MDNDATKIFNENENQNENVGQNPTQNENGTQTQNEPQQEQKEVPPAYPRKQKSTNKGARVAGIAAGAALGVGAAVAGKYAYDAYTDNPEEEAPTQEETAKEEAEPEKIATDELEVSIKSSQPVHASVSHHGTHVETAPYDETDVKVVGMPADSSIVNSGDGNNISVVNNNVTVINVQSDDALNDASDVKVVGVPASTDVLNAGDGNTITNENNNFTFVNVESSDTVHDPLTQDASVLNVEQSIEETIVEEVQTTETTPAGYSQEALHQAFYTPEDSGDAADAFGTDIACADNYGCDEPAPEDYMDCSSDDGFDDCMPDADAGLTDI